MGTNQRPSANDNAALTSCQDPGSFISRDPGSFISVGFTSSKGLARLGMVHDTAFSSAEVFGNHAQVADLQLGRCMFSHLSWLKPILAMGTHLGGETPSDPSEN